MRAGFSGPFPDVASQGEAECRGGFPSGHGLRAGGARATGLVPFSGEKTGGNSFFRIFAYDNEQEKDECYRQVLGKAETVQAQAGLRRAFALCFQFPHKTIIQIWN